MSKVEIDDMLSENIDPRKATHILYAYSIGNKLVRGWITHSKNKKIRTPKICMHFRYSIFFGRFLQS